MTTQIVSFLIFALAFILLYFFYKKEDRKKILVISGLIFLLPFSFSYFQIPNVYGTFVLPIVAVFLVLFRFVNSHHRFFFLFFSLYFFGMIFTVKHITIVNNQGSPSQKIVLTSNINFTFQNGKKVILPIEGGELINNTNQHLYIEKVEYGVGLYGSEDNNKIIDELVPFSCIGIDYKVDYFFEDPPVMIDIYAKQGESMPDQETKYWLHN